MGRGWRFGTALSAPASVNNGAQCQRNELRCAPREIPNSHEFGFRTESRRAGEPESRRAGEPESRRAGGSDLDNHRISQTPVIDRLAAIGSRADVVRRSVVSSSPVSRAVNTSRRRPKMLLSLTAGPHLSSACAKEFSPPSGKHYWGPFSIRGADDASVLITLIRATQPRKGVRVCRDKPDWNWE